MDDRVGQQWGNYRLLRLLGRGGFAKVYLGQHVRLASQQAALKILSTHLSQEDVQKFHQEAETIVSLVHPHIVRVLDFELNEGIPFLVMDYAPKGSLRQQHRRGERVDLATVVSYVQQVADGLQYAHDRKIIHRDIKPDNMLIGSRGELVLSDFGIATIAHATSSQSAQVAIGTIPYMAPEQIREHPRQASDQYALAVTIYEWLAGRHPFTGTFTEIAVKHMMVPPPPLRDFVPGLPEEVERVISTALAKDPKARFRSVETFAREFINASGIENVKVNIRTRLAQSHTLSTIALLPVNKAGTQIDVHHANTVDEISKMQPEQVPQSQFPLPLEPLPLPVSEIASPPSEQKTLMPTVTNTAKIADITHEASLQSKDKTKQRQVSRRRVIAGLIVLGAIGSGIIIRDVVVNNGGQSSSVTTPIGTLLITYYGHHNAVRTLAWSPDGNRIASGDEDHAVQVWDITTGTKAFTYSGHKDWVRSVAWSPDGKRIVSSSLDNTAQVWDATTGANILTYKKHTDHVHTVAWSPDGRHIVSGSDDTTVQVWDATTGAQSFVYDRHPAAVESVAWSPDGKHIASASDDRTVHIIDASSGTLVFIYNMHKDWVLSVAWSPDGKRIASTGRDQIVRVWDATTGATILTNNKHTYWTEAVSWSPDGKSIASASDDKTVQVWNTTLTASTSTYIRQAADQMYAVAWSPQGKYIASAGLDKTVQVWNAY